MALTRRLLALIRNEFQREFASRFSIVFFLVLPLGFTAAVGAGLSGMSGGEEPAEYRTRLYVRADNEGPLVEAFLEALGDVNLAVAVVEELPEERFGLEIPADFSPRLRSGERVTVTLHTLPTQRASQAVEQYVQAAAGRLGGAALIADLGTSQAEELDVVTTSAERRSLFEEVLVETLEAAQDPPAVAEVQWPDAATVAESASAMATGAEQASAGQLVTWVQITLLGAAEVLVDERLRGTLKRLLVTPAGRATVLTGKLLARLILGLVQMALLLVGGALIFQVGWGEQPLATAVVSVAFALATVGLGMLVATFVRTRGQANSVVVGLALAMAALGGAWYPLEVTPALYRQAVQVLPSTWAMRAYTNLLARGATLGDVLPQVSVLLAFAIVFVAAGIWRLRAYE